MKILIIRETFKLRLSLMLTHLYILTYHEIFCPNFFFGKSMAGGYPTYLQFGHMSKISWFFFMGPSPNLFQVRKIFAHLVFFWGLSLKRYNSTRVFKGAASKLQRSKALLSLRRYFSTREFCTPSDFLGSVFKALLFYQGFQGCSFKDPVL